MAKRKFATIINEDTFRDLRAFAKESKYPISEIVDEALKSHLRTVRVRPVFRSAVDKVLEQHSDVLKLLAK